MTSLKTEESDFPERQKNDNYLFIWDIKRITAIYIPLFYFSEVDSYIY